MVLVTLCRTYTKDKLWFITQVKIYQVSDSFTTTSLNNNGTCKFITNKDIECETTDIANILVAHGSILYQIRYTSYYEFVISDIANQIYWSLYDFSIIEFDCMPFFHTTNINCFCEIKLFTLCVRMKCL